MEIQSVYEIIQLSKGGDTVMETVNGTGQAPIRELRKKYHFFTKFILTGFKINSKFVPLKLRLR